MQNYSGEEGLRSIIYRSDLEMSDVMLSCLVIKEMYEDRKTF